MLDWLLRVDLKNGPGKKKAKNPRQKPLEQAAAFVYYLPGVTNNNGNPAQSALHDRSAV
jgi:hypothetical protein